MIKSIEAVISNYFSKIHSVNLSYHYITALIVSTYSFIFSSKALVLRLYVAAIPEPSFSSFMSSYRSRSARSREVSAADVSAWVASSLCFAILAFVRFSKSEISWSI